MTILVTGGAGFIGSNFILDWLAHSDEPVINLDLLTYASNPSNLESLRNDPRYTFALGDIGDRELVAQLLKAHSPRAVVHLAAESHVDRSIHWPDNFIRTNILGTHSLLEAVRGYWDKLSVAKRSGFRFLFASTDEVYGSLEANQPPCNETRRYEPNSPYSASKAAGNHLVRAWTSTWGLPTLTVNCGNNYGPYQFPEKLIPLVIANAIAGRALPIYGDGLQVRDWIYVRDHCNAMRRVLEHGRVGETYNVGGRDERTNISVVEAICTLMDELQPAAAGPYSRLITFVTDRAGHDRRYALDTGKLERDLDWRPSETFESGLRRTVAWYLAQRAWLTELQSGSYREWLSLNYAVR